MADRGGHGQLDRTGKVRRQTVQKTQKIAPCLWFDTQAEEAAKFYTSIFENSRIVNTVRYGKAGYEFHKRPPGSIMTVEFELGGQTLNALHGGPGVQFKQAVSLPIMCHH